MLITTQDIPVNRKWGQPHSDDIKQASAEIKQRITISILAAKLYPGWKPKKSCLSPFREEKNPSFSVYDNDTKFKDYGTGEGGDVFDFYRIATGCSQRDAFLFLKEMIDGGSLPAPIVRTPIPDDFLTTAPPKKQWRPELREPTNLELTELSELRSICIPALQIAVDRGLLKFGLLKGHRSFVITDKARRSYNARRLDGKAWDHLSGNPKAWLLSGSEGNWPIGIQEAELFPAIALCEGGPDLLAAFGHAYASGLENLVAPVCMLGASARIPDEAIPHLKDKRVRIFVHDDPAGMEASERWAHQLTGVASKIDGFVFTGLIRADGSPVSDLNDLLIIDGDCWEENRETIESVMNFVTTKEK